MNKKIIYTIAVIFQLYSLSQISLAEEAWQSISSSTMSYTVQYPQQGWMATLEYLQENVPEYVIRERAMFWNELGAEIAIDVWEGNPDMNIRQWIDTHYAILGFNSAELEPITATIKNLEALRYVFHNDTESIPDSIWTFFAYQNKIFRLSYFEGDQGESTSVYNHMVITFEFGIATPMTLQTVKGGRATLMTKSTTRVNSCGGETHCSGCCGVANPFPCCSYVGTNNGNCTWWAWEQACRIWGVDVPARRNAIYWAADLAANGYQVHSTPGLNTIGCQGTTDWGHVAWVIATNATQVNVSEQGCRGWYGVREHWYTTGYFSEGFIYPKTPCGDVSGIWSAMPSAYTLACDVTVKSGYSLNIKPGATINYNSHSFTVNGQLIWGP